MSEARGTKLTYQGLTLLAKAITGQELRFTRVLMGDGILAEGQNIRELTDLIIPKLNLPIKDVKVTGVGTSVMETELKNANLVSGFFAREVGIFAKDGESEILYAVRNTGDDSEYIPAGGGSEVWDVIYDLVTVVDQAINITANIDGSIAYVTRLDLRDHVDAVNPHPNTPNLKPEVVTPSHFWVQELADKQLHPVSLDNTRRAILGGEASTIPVLNGRLTQVEREQANIALRLEAEGIYTDGNMMLSEDFVIPDAIDTFVVNVLSVVAGDNGIDVASMTGILPGAWYTITDGINQEYILVKSCIKNGSVFRIIANKNIEYTYLIAQTLILRSTAQIGVGVVYGSGDKKGFLWQPSVVWSGVNANVAVSLPLETTQANAELFDIDGDIGFTSDGFITLA
jgi:hypothetical protein